MSDRNELTKAVSEAARPHGETRILDCARAFELAERFNVSPEAVGQLCNDEKIKIRSCQLGCFK